MEFYSPVLHSYFSVFRELEFYPTSNCSGLYLPPLQEGVPLMIPKVKHRSKDSSVPEGEGCG